MIGTINCIYETPCGWCSKWDKKCNNKLGEMSNYKSMDKTDLFLQKIMHGEDTTNDDIDVPKPL